MYIVFTSQFPVHFAPCSTHFTLNYFKYILLFLQLISAKDVCRLLCLSLRTFSCHTRSNHTLFSCYRHSSEYNKGLYKCHTLVHVDWHCSSMQPENWTSSHMLQSDTVLPITLSPSQDTSRAILISSNASAISSSRFIIWPGKPLAYLTVTETDCGEQPNFWVLHTCNTRGHIE